MEYLYLLNDRAVGAESLSALIKKLGVEGKLSQQNQVDLTGRIYG